MFDYARGLSDRWTESEIVGAEMKATLLGYYHKLVSGDALWCLIFTCTMMYQSSGEPLYNKPDLCYSLGLRKKS